MMVTFEQRSQYAKEPEEEVEEPEAEVLAAEAGADKEWHGGLYRKIQKVVQPAGEPRSREVASQAGGGLYFRGSRILELEVVRAPTDAGARVLSDLQQELEKAKLKLVLIERKRPFGEGASKGSRSSRP
jgi:hypothetical protein